MGTVKYTGPVASFHCPTNAEIRSLKVHFSPKQEGMGDPSPENVREIVGWDGVEVYGSKKNLFSFGNFSYESQGVKFIAEGSSIHITGTNNSNSINYTGNTFNNVPSVWLPAGTYRYYQSSANTYTKGYYLSYRWDDPRTGETVSINRVVGDIVLSTSRRLYINCGVYGTTSQHYHENIDEIYVFQISPGDIDNDYEPYQGSTTNYEFGVLGKNKFDKNAVTDYCRINGSGEITPQSGMSISDYIPVIPGQQYTLTNEGSFGGNRRHAYYDENKNYLQVIANYSNPMTFTIPNNTYYLRLSLYNDYLDTTQLELGSTATTYEPYDSNHTVYGGWVDLITGEVCEEWTKEKVSSVITGKNTYGSYWVFSSKSGVGVSESGAAIAEAYIGYDGMMPLSQIGNRMPDLSIAMRSINGNIFIKDTRYEEYDDFISNMGETMLCYKLSTPNIYSLTPTQLQTFLGQNNVWSNADYVEVEYDLHETQDILARKQFIIANQPHIVSPAAAPLQNFVTDMAAPLKECKVEFRPVQDLHGYDRPWVGGGGKNLFDVTKLAAETNSWTINILDLPTGTYTMSSNKGTAADTNIYMYFRITGSNTLSDSNVVYNAHSTTLTIEEGQTAEIVYRRASGTNLYSDYTWQIEKGSTATSYEPYENICPISGWTGCEVYRSGKNLFDINLLAANNITISNGVATATATNFNKAFGSSFVPLNLDMSTNRWTLTMTAYTDGNSSTADATGLIARFVYTDGTKQMLSFNNQNTSPVTLSITSTINKTPLGIQISYGSTGANIWHITNIQLEPALEATFYEPYTGTTIPITFPATTNLFNEQWEQGNIEVGNNAGSSTCMRTGFIDVNPSTSYYLYTSRENNVFVFEYLEDGTYANKVNSVHTSHVFTTDSTTKKIRIADRNSGTETVNTGINYPSTATYYEPYGTIYGGYVDLIKGELVQEWEYQTSTWGEIKKFTPDATTGYQWSYLWFNNPIKVTGSGGTPQNTLCNVGIQNWSGTGTAFPHYYTVAANSGYRMNVILHSETDDSTIIQGIAPLLTPIVHQLTPFQLKTLRGTNNIWSNSNGDITIQFWKH